MVRWDDPANASEFADAFAAFESAGPPAVSPPERDRRSPDLAFTDLVWGPSDAAFELRRVSPETTVVLVGPASFVERATVSGGNSSVTVGVGG